jgi:hypothetical protein
MFYPKGSSYHQDLAIEPVIVVGILETNEINSAGRVPELEMLECDGFIYLASLLSITLL